MSHLRAIEFALERQLQAVRQMRLEQAAKGKAQKLDEVKGIAFYDKLDAIGEHVVTALRDLRSAEHLQQMRAGNIHAVPREARFAERQSIDGQMQNVRRVRELALQLAREIRDLYGNAISPTTADMVEGTHKLLTEIGKNVDRTLLQNMVRQVSDGPAIAPASSATLSAADAFTQVWLLLAWVVAMTRSRKKK